MRVNLAVDPKAVDFKSDASKIIQEVNSWISSVTQGLIPELLQENDLNFSTRLVLLNAVYFKGLWKKVFDLQDTLALEFNNFDGTKSVVQMMGGKKPLTLFEGPGFDLLTLPFEGDKLSLKLVLPRVEELPLSENLLTQALNELFNDGINTELFVRLPRFEVRTRNKMNSVFERIGVKQIFDPGVADLTNLASHLPGEGGLFVGPIIHEAVVKVDEQGAEAAAATAMALMGAGMAKKTFVFDRPFFFFITLNDQEKGRKEILFSGAIQKL
jgi:serpin B